MQPLSVPSPEGPEGPALCEKARGWGGGENWRDSREREGWWSRGGAESPQAGIRIPRLCNAEGKFLPFLPWEQTTSLSHL